MEGDLFSPPLAPPQVELAEVTAIDPGEGRVTVRLLASRAADGADVETPAVVACPFASDGAGAMFIPAIGERVVVAFLNGDPRLPVVLGSVWHGNAAPPESPGDGDVSRWGVYTPGGNRIEIEESGGGVVTLKTAGGQTVALDESGGSVTVRSGGSTVTLTGSGITIEASGVVEVTAATVSVSAASVSVDAAVSQFSGVVSCDVLQATTVISSTYTPGAGNVW